MFEGTDVVHVRPVAVDGDEYPNARVERIAGELARRDAGLDEFEQSSAVERLLFDESGSESGSEPAEVPRIQPEPGDVATVGALDALDHSRESFERLAVLGHHCFALVCDGLHERGDDEVFGDWEVVGDQAWPNAESISDGAQGDALESIGKRHSGSFAHDLGSALAGSLSRAHDRST